MPLAVAIPGAHRIAKKQVIVVGNVAGRFGAWLVRVCNRAIFFT